MASDKDPSEFVPGGNFMLWAYVLGAPFLWLCQLELNYALVPTACATGRAILVQIAWIPFFIGAGALGALAVRDWIRLCSLPRERANMRCRFMAVLGICTSALFALTMLAQGFATFVLNP